jgi:hypothetical protein
MMQSQSNQDENEIEQLLRSWSGNHAEAVPGDLASRVKQKKHQLDQRQNALTVVSLCALLVGATVWLTVGSRPTIKTDQESIAGSEQAKPKVAASEPVKPEPAADDPMRQIRLIEESFRMMKLRDELAQQERDLEELRNTVHQFNANHAREKARVQVLSDWIKQHTLAQSP